MKTFTVTLNLTEQELESIRKESQTFRDVVFNKWKNELQFGISKDSIIYPNDNSLFHLEKKLINEVRYSRKINQEINKINDINTLRKIVAENSQYRVLFTKPHSDELYTGNTFNQEGTLSLSVAKSWIEKNIKYQSADSELKEKLITELVKLRKDPLKSNKIEDIKNLRSMNLVRDVYGSLFDSISVGESLDPWDGSRLTLFGAKIWVENNIPDYMPKKSFDPFDQMGDPLDENDGTF